MKSLRMNCRLSTCKSHKNLDFEFYWRFSGNTNVSLELYMYIKIKICQILVHGLFWKYTIIPLSSSTPAMSSSNILRSEVIGGFVESSCKVLVDLCHTKRSSLSSRRSWKSNLQPSPGIGKIISTDSKPLGIFDWRPGSFSYPVIPCRFWMTGVQPKKIFPALLFEVD
jgi:hypothetical protein